MMEMNLAPSSRERVKRLLRRKPVEGAVKGELCLDTSIIRHTLGCERIGFEEKVHFVQWIGSDIICLTPASLGFPGGLVQPDESLLTEAALWIQQTKLFTFVMLDGVFELGVRTFGFQSFLRQMQKNPDEIKKFSDSVEENNKNFTAKLAEHGVDGILIADDIAYQDGLLFSPRTFRELFLPSLSRQVEHIASTGIPVFFHSDGNYHAIIPSLIEAGFVGLHCIDKNCGMYPEALFKEYKDSLCLWGTIDVACVPLLHTQEASEIHTELSYIKAL